MGPSHNSPAMVTPHNQMYVTAQNKLPVGPTQDYPYMGYHQNNSQMVPQQAFMTPPTIQFPMGFPQTDSPMGHPQYNLPMHPASNNFSMQPAQNHDIMGGPPQAGFATQPSSVLFVMNSLSVNYPSSTGEYPLNQPSMQGLFYSSSWYFLK